MKERHERLLGLVQRTTTAQEAWDDGARESGRALPMFCGARWRGTIKSERDPCTPCWG
jgi:hypothetical protein